MYDYYLAYRILKNNIFLIKTTYLVLLIHKPGEHGNKNKKTILIIKFIKALIN